MMRLVIALCLVTLWSGAATAHTRSQSASDWQIDGSRIEGVFSVDERRATLLYGLDGSEQEPLADLLSRHLEQSITVTQSGSDCGAIAAPRSMAAREGYLRVALAFECPALIVEESTQLRVGAFFELSSTHLHIIRVQSASGVIFEGVLSRAGDPLELSTAQAPGADGVRFLAFFRTGFGHVLSGWDHLAFLAALMLLAGRPGPIVVTVTGFTIGHSLTMALVALGVLRPYGIAVEVLIGFSILYAAMEAGARDLNGPQKRSLWLGTALAGGALAGLAMWWGQSLVPVLAVLAASWFVLSQAPARTTRNGGWSWRAPALAALFGLAHGAGFAGSLLGHDLGGQGLVSALLGFNLGVEAGQLVAVGVMVGAAYGLCRLTQAPVSLVRAPAAAILFGAGTYWTVIRLLGA